MELGSVDAYCHSLSSHAFLCERGWRGGSLSPEQLCSVHCVLNVVLCRLSAASEGSVGEPDVYCKHGAKYYLICCLG